MKEIHEMNDEEIRTLMSQMTDELETRSKKREERRLKRESLCKTQREKTIVNSKNNNSDIVGKYYKDNFGAYYRVLSVNRNNVATTERLVYKLGFNYVHSYATSGYLVGSSYFTNGTYTEEITEKEYKSIEDKIYNTSKQHKSLFCDIDRLFDPIPFSVSSIFNRMLF